MGKVYLVPPGGNILKALAVHILEMEEPSEPVLVFPHRRPGHFLIYYLSRLMDERGIERPLLLPEIYSIEDWVHHLSVGLEDPPKRSLNEFDQAWLIYEVTRDVSHELAGSWDDFFPWALRLVNVIDEFDHELITPGDLLYPPEERLPVKAREILERLGRIYRGFTERIERGNYTTTAKRLRGLAESEFTPSERPIFLVGFYSLSRAEERFFRRLYDGGASFFWHADPEELPDFYQRWKKNWRPEIHILQGRKKKPIISFFEAHDLHSELRELRRVLSITPSGNRPDERAVILLSSSSLVPLIHHLPGCTVNITLGYPLNLTSISVFLYTLMELINHRDRVRGYHFKELIEFLRLPLFDIRHRRELEEELYKYGAPFLSKDDILKHASVEKGYIKRLWEEVVEPFEDASTPEDIAGALKRGLSYLRIEGRGMGILEREFFGTLIEKVIPVLENSLFAHHRMGQAALFRLLRGLISNLRVPFEGEPLTGLQVMGLLESRLLSFKEVYFLDMNEGILPDVEEVNPLLPNEVKRALGLPDREREETILRYLFERLLYTTDRSHLFCQVQTTSRSSLGGEGKKLRSRYVEQLIWQIEKDRGRLLDKDEGPLKASHIMLNQEAIKKDEFIRKDDFIKDHILNLLKARPISATLLNLYISCPLRFLYQEVLKLETRKDPDEFQADILGRVVHKVLEGFFREACKGSLPHEIKREKLSAKRLLEMFKDGVRNDPYLKNLSKERRFLLEKTGEYRLSIYLKNHEDVTIIDSLEHQLAPVTIEVDRSLFRLTGRIDRIDQREGKKIILDYKTGRLGKTGGLVEGDDGFTAQDIGDARGFYRLAKAIGDIQLPLYIYIFCIDKRESGEYIPWSEITAAYVELARYGRERYFISIKDLERIDETYSWWFEERFPHMLKYIIRHILYSPFWYPAGDKGTCIYCPYKEICKYEA